MSPLQRIAPASPCAQSAISCFHQAHPKLHSNMQAMRVNAKEDSGNWPGYSNRFFASYGVFGAPGDNRLPGQIFLVRGLTEVGIEAVVADGKRIVVGAGLLVLHLQDAAACDQNAAR